MIAFAEEIMRAAGPRQREYHSALDAACRALGILGLDEELIELRDLFDWRRGGSESFVCAGEVIASASGNTTCFTRPVLVKCYAGFGLGVEPETRVEQWIQRASQLRWYGCRVCQVYGFGHGALFLQYIPFSLCEVLASGNLDILIRDRLSLALVELTHAMDAIPISPISILPDLRTDGTEVFVVDFGEDLGDVPACRQVPDGYCGEKIAGELRTRGFYTLALYLEKELKLWNER